MAFLQTFRRSSSGAGGGGTGEVLRWVKIDEDITTPIVGGVYYVQLALVPIDIDGIFVYFERQELHIDDFTWDLVTNRIYLNFDFDPATDTESGTANLFIKYQYAV